MRARADLLLTKTAPASHWQGPGRSGDGVADPFRRQAVRRLEVVAWLTFAGQFVVWLAVNLVQGTLADEFATPLQWGFPIGVMAASAGVGLLARGKWLDPAIIVRLGLIYQVIISFGIAAGTYVEAFRGVEPDTIRFDRTGLTFVGPWMPSRSAERTSWGATGSKGSSAVGGWAKYGWHHIAHSREQQRSSSFTRSR